MSYEISVYALQIFSHQNKSPFNSIFYVFKILKFLYI